MKKLILFLAALTLSSVAFAETEQEYTHDGPPAFVNDIMGKYREIKSPMDLLKLFHVGAQVKYQLDYNFLTDTSLKPFANPITDNKLSLQANLATPIGDIVFAYNHNWMNWDRKGNSSYVLTHFNFYNFRSLFGLDPFFVMVLPTGTFASGNSSLMSYRELDLRIFNAVGVNETAYVFWDQDNPGYSIYHNERRISLISLRGLVSSFADYDMWNYIYGNEGVLLNDMMESLDIPFKLPVVPYADLFFRRIKTEARYMDLVLDSIDTQTYKFGFNFGLLFAYSFFREVGPGRLIVQPRVDLRLFEGMFDNVSYHEPIYESKKEVAPGDNNYMPFRTGINASIAVNYFF